MKKNTTLLEYYKKMSEDADAAQKFWSCANKQKGGNYGAILAPFNTNIRTLSSALCNQYRNMLTVDGRCRSQWPKYSTEHGNQEFAKHYAVPMRETGFFFVDRNGTYYHSQRGKVFYDMATSQSFNEIEKDFIFYLSILPASFNGTEKYYAKRTRELYGYYGNGKKNEEFEEIEQQILEDQKKLVKGVYGANGNKLEEVAKYDFFYIGNIYREYGSYDFIKKYYSAEDTEKDDLKKYIIENLSKKNKCCILSKKFSPGGNYTADTFVTITWMLYLTRKLQLRGEISYKEFISSLLEDYSSLFTKIDKEKIEKYISENNSVFKAIYNVWYNINTFKEVQLSEADKEKILKEGISFDTTNEEGQAKREQASKFLKDEACKNSQYKCILGNVDCGCPNTYFTRGNSNENYLEVHHFIPREFSASFEKSIEVLENYIPLCPFCHRKIHHASNNEKIPMIEKILEFRQKSLQQKGLAVNKSDMKGYYKIK